MIPRKYCFSFIYISCVFLLSGCVIQQMGNAVKYNIAGDHYLTTEQYKKGISSFKDDVISTPDNHLANFYYGRFLLADKQYKKSIQYLSKARDLAPDKSDYHFWLGVAYGSIGNKKSERENYQKALKLEKDHLQSLIYLGNNQLLTKEYKAAIASYDKALDIWPSSPTALYNRSLIQGKLGRKPEALEGWQEYLSYYPSGSMARKAVNHLNLLGDYSFRNYTLGARTVTIEKIYFQPFTAELTSGAKKSIEFIGTIASKMKKGRLQVLVYQLKNKKLAQKKAINIKKHLLKSNPNFKKQDIGVSWFDASEIIRVGKSKKTIHDSVSFFISRK